MLLAVLSVLLYTNAGFTAIAGSSAGAGGAGGAATLPLFPTASLLIPTSDSPRPTPHLVREENMCQRGLCRSEGH